MDVSEALFERIWQAAQQAAEHALTPFAQRVMPANAWGSVYVVLAGDFGRWLKRHYNTQQRRDLEIPIPHSNYEVLQAYALAFQTSLAPYGIATRNDTAYN